MEEISIEDVKEWRAFKETAALAELFYEMDGDEYAKAMRDGFLVGRTSRHPEEVALVRLFNWDMSKQKSDFWAFLHHRGRLYGMGF